MLQREELRAAVVMVVGDENKKSISSNFLIYSGICYGQPTNNQINLSKFLKI